MTLDEAKKLPPDAINRVIAEELGWSFPYVGSTTIGIPPKEWKNPNPWKMSEDGFGSYSAPDFFHDLNACHEAEESLTAEQWESYMFEFRCIYCECEPANPCNRPMHSPANIRAIALAVVLSERKTNEE